MGLLPFDLTNLTMSRVSVMLLVIMASLRNHECLTKEQIREYVQRHAVLTQVDPATAAAEAMETTETAAEAMETTETAAEAIETTETAAEAELEVEAEIGPGDSLGAQPVDSVEAMELEPTEAAAEAMETTETAAEAM